jgi:hypothetical protein
LLQNPWTHADYQPTRAVTDAREQPFNPPICLSDSDFLSMTEGLGIAKEGRLHEGEFVRLLREQLEIFAQARLSGALEFWATTERDLATLGTLKHMLMAQATRTPSPLPSFLRRRPASCARTRTQARWARPSLRSWRST